jgi:hypothetical protein
MGEIAGIASNKLLYFEQTYLNSKLHKINCVELETDLENQQP